MNKQQLPVITIFVDESCGICNKVRNILSRFNYKGKCNFEFAGDMNFSADTEAMKNRYYDLYAFDGVSFYTGYDTYIEIFRRDNFLLIFYWLMKINFIRFLGERIYRKVADRRACKINHSKILKYL